MNTLRLTTALLATMAAATPASMSAQADAKSTITIYPFGASQSAMAASRELNTLSARRALEGVIATNRLNAKDQTANPAIQTQIDAAGGLSQFNAVKPIERDKQLQSKYLLLGYVESADAKPSGTGKNKKPIYSGTVVVTLQVIDVETGAVVDSRAITVDNSIDNTGQGKSCDQGNFLQKAACKRLNDAQSNKQRELIGGDDADTPQKAVAGAVDKIKTQTTDFLNSLFTAGRIK